MKAKEVLKMYDSMVETNKEVTDVSVAYVNAKKFVAKLLQEYQMVKRPQRKGKGRELRV